MGVVIAKLVVTLLLGWMLVLLLFSPIPPKRGSRWYPDPDRWDYSSLLMVFAILNTQGTKPFRIFLKGFVFLILLVMVLMVWFTAISFD